MTWQHQHQAQGVTPSSVQNIFISDQGMTASSFAHCCCATHETKGKSHAPHKISCLCVGFVHFQGLAQVWFMAFGRRTAFHVLLFARDLIWREESRPCFVGAMQLFRTLVRQPRVCRTVLILVKDDFEEKGSLAVVKHPDVMRMRRHGRVGKRSCLSKPP